MFNVCQDHIYYNRNVPSFLYSASSLPGSNSNCPGGCIISNCLACYYSYNDLPSPRLPSPCPQQCNMTNDEVDENCMTKWGHCIYRNQLIIYQSVSDTYYNNFNILYYNYYRCYLMKEMIGPFVVGLINVLSLNELMLVHDYSHCFV